ncbi:prolipoprotein diacylglyceryl transferase [Paracidobacterium acidisoli]|uniref:prolipoprotein diacylglyceryl transferase n=1 Tax=Paracidobacterium acidisoli TaxID=2303751 RepID=UPI001314353F|nr:prolipoprotein diacylglyceryl transferase family protein [Paracidobacterium acidisoli]MBT9332456.1 prolipoprotein diacylglyceryl transferase [Paracidobacterium acidisoli]
MFPRLFQIGHVGIPTYGVFSAAALLTALALAMHFGRRLGLRADKIWNAGLVAILTALIGERLLLVLAHLSIFRAHPFWILGLTTVRSEWIVMGSVVLGLAAAVLYTQAEGLSLLRAADAAAPALAAGIALERIGALCAGIDYGTPTTLPWGVTYHSLIAAIWYRVPLGVKVHPVQMYEAAASVLIFALLLWWLPRRTQDGELAGGWLLLYGAASFFLGLWNGTPRTNTLFHGTVTIAQAIALVAVLAGGLLWLRRPAEKA